MNCPDDRPLISVITPCYNEEENVDACHQAVSQLFAGALSDFRYEHIFADNASRDRTPEILAGIAARDPNVRVILNSRNFGALPSVFNAMLSASGDAIVPCLACDLQDPPEAIPDMVRLWQSGYKVVYGIRKHREESLPLRSFRMLFYRLVNRLSDTPLPVDSGEFQVIDRVVLDALRRFEDYNPYLRGMIASCGFKATGYPYRWKARKRGLSKANWYRLVDVAINAFVSFSNVPMRLCLLGGFAISITSLLYAIVQLALAIAFPRAMPGVPTLVIALFFFGGVQLFFLGVLGEYICAIHSQVRKRPLVIEAARLNFGEQQDTGAAAASSHARSGL
jgi:glycosyltransferase involved in cell wall biosynthesis